jgi:hypothetical protein
MTYPTRVTQITRALRAEGLPLELACIHGNSYFVFFYDDGTTYEERSIYCASLRQQSTEQWLENGRSFAADVRHQLEA